MTKRVISIILAFALLLSVAAVTVFAENTKVTGKEFLFKEVFVEAFKDEYFYSDECGYDELYYHHVDENDTESEIDWAIIYALFEPVPMEETRIIVDRWIHVGGFGNPFLLHYGLYDVQLNEFIPIEEVDVTKYDGFEKGLAEAKIGNPFGDADLDGELSVLDATYIQRAVAELCEFKLGDDLQGVWVEGCDGPFYYISDIDRDGERTVLDATAIQKKLADIEDSTVAE